MDMGKAKVKLKARAGQAVMATASTTIGPATRSSLHPVSRSRRVSRRRP